MSLPPVRTPPLSARMRSSKTRSIHAGLKTPFLRDSLKAHETVWHTVSAGATYTSSCRTRARDAGTHLWMQTSYAFTALYKQHLAWPVHVNNHHHNGNGASNNQNQNHNANGAWWRCASSCSASGSSSQTRSGSGARLCGYSARIGLCWSLHCLRPAAEGEKDGGSVGPVERMNHWGFPALPAEVDADDEEGGEGVGSGGGGVTPVERTLAHTVLAKALVCLGNIAAARLGKGCANAMTMAANFACALLGGACARTVGGECGASVGDIGWSPSRCLLFPLTRTHPLHCSPLRLHLLLSLFRLYIFLSFIPSHASHSSRANSQSCSPSLSFLCRLSLARRDSLHVTLPSFPSPPNLSILLLSPFCVDALLFPSPLPCLHPHSFAFSSSTFPEFPSPYARPPSLHFPSFPSLLPSFPPSLLPSFPPSLLPSFPPSLLPSFPPSLLPSFPPSLLPSFPPSLLPSFPPSLLPSFPPSLLPSFPPSLLPSFPPSLLPSFPPSLLPSFPPSLLPSFPPSPLPALSHLPPPSPLAIQFAPVSSALFPPSLLPSFLPSFPPFPSARSLPSSPPITPCHPIRTCILRPLPSFPPSLLSPLPALSHLPPPSLLAIQFAPVSSALFLAALSPFPPFVPMLPFCLDGVSCIPPSSFHPAPLVLVLFFPATCLFISPSPSRPPSLSPFASRLVHALPPFSSLPPPLSLPLFFPRKLAAFTGDCAPTASVRRSPAVKWRATRNPRRPPQSNLVIKACLDDTTASSQTKASRRLLSSNHPLSIHNRAMTHRHRPFPRKALSSSLKPSPRTAQCFQLNPPACRHLFRFHNGPSTAPFPTDRRPPSVTLLNPNCSPVHSPFTTRAKLGAAPVPLFKSTRQSLCRSVIAQPRRPNPCHAPDHPFTCARPIRTRFRPAPGRSARAAYPSRPSTPPRRSLTHTTISPLPLNPRSAMPTLSSAQTTTNA
ncbi:hypothetical protein B0H13DRAFT_2523683 [Mycena leptocephala]|nr:hypothetical protein B0H13DRAFT_2523683 [Mycena leptocephala]